MTTINVFLSSTYLDLRKRREEIIESILRLSGVLPRCMEHQPATSDELLEYCLKMVGQCPIYIGLIDSRYGKRFTHNGESLSLTHHEFRQATKLELFRIMCVSTTIDQSEVDDKRGVASFRAEAQQRFPTFFKRNKPVELVRDVMAAVSNILREMNSFAWLFIKKNRRDMENLDEQLRVRKHFAKLVGQADASRFWIEPFHHYAKGKITVCHCCLPIGCRTKLLEEDSWRTEEIVQFDPDIGEPPHYREDV